MAGFKTHITTSTMCGIGYTGAGLYYGVPLESALIAGGLCGVGGMLPDIDSDSGVPFRESMGFAAAIVPMLLLPRFHQFGLNTEQMVLAAGVLYLFVRFGLAKMLAKYTVHRGMFHSIPALLIFGGLVFLLCDNQNLQLRYFKTGGVMLGVFSHLLLDEIYAVEWHRGRWRFKSSFGTALKLWSSNMWSNLSAYGKLILIGVLILGEPAILDRYGQLSPVAVDRNSLAPAVAGFLPPTGPFAAQSGPTDPQTGEQPIQPVEPTDADRTIYDTARRLWKGLQE